MTSVRGGGEQLRPLHDGLLCEDFDFISNKWPDVEDTEDQGI